MLSKAQRGDDHMSPEEIEEDTLWQTDVLEAALMDKFDRGDTLRDEEKSFLYRPGRFLLTCTHNKMDGHTVVTYYAQGRGVHEWAEFNSSIEGSNWEYMGDNVAYAMHDYSPRESRAEEEGYRFQATITEQPVDLPEDPPPAPDADLVLEETIRRRISDLQATVPDTHSNDRLVSSSLSRAGTYVGTSNVLAAKRCVENTLATVQRCGASQDAQAALQLALIEIRRCM